MADIAYNDCNFKVPEESDDYPQSSEFVTSSIRSIMNNAMKNDNNQIVINTNLKLGLPMENINKIAGPFVEAWAVQTFNEVIEDEDNQYKLINVETVGRLHMADVILQFKKERKHEMGITSNIDVKATSDDIDSSGRSPNITSFKRIRTAYIEEPDYIFAILSLKHKVYSERNKESGLMDGIMEVVDHSVYDLKYLTSDDMNYNPALGTGQIQIKDIHYVESIKRTTWELCQLLDEKYLNSSKRTIDDWLELARSNNWIKN